jgi:hypothetical protein
VSAGEYDNNTWLPKRMKVSFYSRKFTGGVSIELYDHKNVITIIGAGGTAAKESASVIGVSELITLYARLHAAESIEQLNEVIFSYFGV